MNPVDASKEELAAIPIPDNIRFDRPVKVRKNGKQVFTKRAEQEANNMARTPNAAPTREKLLISRDNPELEKEISQDPTSFMRGQLTKMLSKEVAINELLYSMSPPDAKAISESNKRIIDLGDALKALPSQSDVEAKGASRSASEVIMDAMDDPELAVEAEAAVINQTMISRADDAFGEGAAE